MEFATSCSPLSAVVLPFLPPSPPSHRLAQFCAVGTYQCARKLPWNEKIQSRDARLKNSRFQSRNEIFDREWFFQSDPSLAAEKQGLGLKFSIENEIFKPRMKISSENDFFVRGGMVFSSDRARMNFFDLWPLWAMEPYCETNYPEGRARHLNVSR